MGTTLWCIDIVHEGINILSIRIIVLHGNLNEHAVPGSLTVNDIVVKRCFAFV